MRRYLTTLTLALALATPAAVLPVVAQAATTGPPPPYVTAKPHCTHHHRGIIYCPFIPA